MTPEAFATAMRDPHAVAVAALHDFRVFVGVFWYAIFPHRPLVGNWHLDRLCDAVQRQVQGDPEYRKLLVEVPPGFNKSVIFSVMRPAWVLLREPWRSSLYFSASPHLAERDSARTRRILEHPHYDLCRQTAVAHGFYQTNWTFRRDQNEKDNFETDQGGVRQCYGIWENWIGIRCDDIIEDDLVNARDAVKNLTPAQLAEKMSELADIRHNAVLSRVIDPKTATRTLVMQGLCEGDPADDEIKRGGWKVLCFPMEFDPEHPQYDPAIDPRTEPGELLHEAWFPHSVVLERKPPTGEMKEEHWSAQYQHRRIPGKARQIQREWLTTARTFHDDPVEVATTCDVVDISIDPSGKGKSHNDEASFQVLGRRGPDAILLHVEDSPQGLKGSEATLVRLTRRFPMYRYVYIEDKALGPALIETARAGIHLPEEATPIRIRGVIEASPGRLSKGQRLDKGTVPRLRAGNLILPDESVCSGVRAWRSDHELFVDGPASRRDGNVDATSQVFLQWDNEDMDPVWCDGLPEAVGGLFRAVQRGATTLYGTLPRVHPAETYLLGLVPTLAPGVPTFGVVVADNGDQVASVVVDGGEDAVVAALVDLAEHLGRAGYGADPQAPILRVRVGASRASLPAARALVDRLTKFSGHLRVVPEAGSYRGDPAAIWMDDAQGRTALLGPLRTALLAERLLLADPNLIGALRSVVIDRSTGQPRGARSQDPGFCLPGADLDIRFLALALAEGLRQRQAPVLVALPRRPNDLERHLAERPRVSEDAVSMAMATLRR